MHVQAAQFVRVSVDAFRVGGARAVLDLGGRDVNGTLHGLFSSPVTTVDIADGPGVDIVADAADWFPDRLYDVALCTEVFEHTPRWPEIIGTAHVALRTGGLLIATCATGNRPPHGAATDHPLPGEHYANVDPDAVRAVLEPWSESSVKVADGVFGGDDLYAWAVK